MREERHVFVLQGWRRRGLLLATATLALVGLGFGASVRTGDHASAGAVTPGEDAVAAFFRITPPPSTTAPDLDDLRPNAASPAASSAAVAPGVFRWFDGRPVRPVRAIRMQVTAYSPDEQSCAPFADGFTASGYSVWTNGMKMVAADEAVLPFGSLVSIAGYHAGQPVPVLDRGGKIRGHRLDVLLPTHAQALGWGVRHLDVTVWEYADGKPVGFRMQW